VLLWANNEYADGGYDPHFLERTLTIGGETKTDACVAECRPIPSCATVRRCALRCSGYGKTPRSGFRLLGRKLALTLSAFGLQNPDNRGVAAALRLADGVYWLFLALGGLRAVAAAASASACSLWLAVLFLGWTLLTILLYAGGSRPLLPAQPLITLGAAVGVCALWARRQAQM
jgi:hypothetical protein